LDRESAIDTLVNHHSSQRYHPEHHYQNVVDADGKYLGPYVPYIGKFYYDARPRLLIYAMAQNLGRAPHLIKAWLNSPDKGLLRQYHDQDTPRVHVYPYDNGRLKVIAALTLNSYPETLFHADQDINDLIVITNFVKFSFYRIGPSGGRLDANPPLDIYDDMWKYYCKYEVSTLRPDIIIGVGREVANAIVRNLKREREPNVVVLGVPFPGRLNLNSRWVPKGRELIKVENYDPAIDISEMQALLKGTPDMKGRVGRAISTDWYYFREMKAFISKQFSNCLVRNSPL